MSGPASLRWPWVVQADGWVRATSDLQHLPSPNHDARPDAAAIELLVLHNISLPPGDFGSNAVAQLFTNTLDHDTHPFFATLLGVQVSAHFFIDRRGQVTQFVSCLARAWHAGLSSFEGRARCNDFSVGIELEGTDFLPFTAAQYDSLARLTAALRAAYPLRAVRGHADIAPGRKTDPGPFFDWNAYAQAASKLQLPFWPDTALPLR